MTWLFLLLAMAVIALAAGVVTGRISGGMDAPESSSPFRGLPADDVRAEDVEALRFTPALRGYRMGEVDDVLDRLVHELGRRDEEIARLRATLRGEAYTAPDGDGPGEADVEAQRSSPYTGEAAPYAAAEPPDVSAESPHGRF